MKRVLPIIVGLIVLAAAAWFILGPSRPAGPAVRPVVIALANDVSSLDPIRMQDAFSLRAGYLVGDGLARLDAANEIVPAIAERWENTEDFTKWTFHLREGVTFHPHSVNDGKPVSVTAADVIFSFERMLAADAVTAGPLSGILAGAKEFQEGKAETVSGIRTVSPTTLEFSLTRPDSLFPGRISAPAYAIVNKAAVEAAGTEFGQTSHCSTGPYRFVERRGNELVLARFDGYWGGFGENSPEQVVIRTIKEDTLALAELRSNRVSIAYASPPMLKGIVERKDGKIALTESAAVAFRAQTNPVFNTYFLAFNQPSVHPDLRRAIFHAIDRNEVIAASVPASGFPAAGPIPLACAGYKPEVGPDRDLDKARAALDAFKTANPGSAPKLTILVHELSEAITTGEVIQSQLGKLGIEVELVQRNFNAVVGEIQKGSFEATVMGFEYQYSEPQLILENFYTSAAIPLPNLFHYKNPATDSAIAELLQQPHDKERLQAVAGVEKQIVEAVPGVFLYQTAQTLLIDPALSGVLANGANYLDLTRATWK